MRRLTKLIAVTAVSGFVLAGCGTAADKDEPKTKEVKCETTKIEGKPKVAMAYDVGGRGDRSFNDSSFAGLTKATKDFSVTSTDAEAAKDEPESVREERLRGFADDGYNTIVGVGYAYSESVNKVAPDYPNVAFGIIDGFDPDKTVNCNVAYLGFAEHEGSFLVGAAAALETKADHVGFVGGVNSALIQKFEAGYVAGAKAVKPEIKVDVTYIEESNPDGFNKPDDGNSAARGMYESGADIVFHAAGASGNGVFDAAVEADKKAIGVDSDQYLTASDKQKAHIITSMLKRVDTATYDFIKSVVDGKPNSSYTVFSLKDDGVGFSTSGDMLSKDTIAKVNDYKAKIISGEIKVSDKP